MGLLLHHKAEQIEKLMEYWWLFVLEVFAEHMSGYRFLLMMRSLHFLSNSVRDENMQVDKLQKIKPVVDFFSNKMLLNVNSCPWIFLQYIRNKKHKYSVKLYMLNEPTGVLLNVNVCTSALDVTGGRGHAIKIFLHLMKDRLKSDHALYIDNFVIVAIWLQNC